MQRYTKIFIYEKWIKYDATLNGGGFSTIFFIFCLTNHYFYDILYIEKYMKGNYNSYGC